MPEGSEYGRHEFPSGFKHIGLMGPSHSAAAYFYYPFAWRSVSFLFEDFKGGGLLESGDTDFEEGNWTSGQNNAGTAFDIIATQLAGGVAQGVTAAYAADTTAIWGDHLWLGDNRCGCEFRFKIDDVDNQQFEVGFTDTLSDGKESAINNIDTPTVTNGAADVALIGRDTSKTLKTLAFITDGSTSNMNSTKTNLGTRNYTNAIYGGARVQLSGNQAYGYVLDANSAIVESAGHGDGATAAAQLPSQIEGGVLLHPLLLMESLTTSAITVDIDYIAVWQDRIA